MKMKYPGKRQARHGLDRAMRARDKVFGEGGDVSALNRAVDDAFGILLRQGDYYRQHVEIGSMSDYDRSQAARNRTATEASLEGCPF